MLLVDTRETALFDMLRDSYSLSQRSTSPTAGGVFQGQLHMYATLVGRDAEDVRKDVQETERFVRAEDAHGPGVSHTCRVCGEHAPCDKTRPCYRVPAPAGSLCIACRSEVSE